MWNPFVFAGVGLLVGAAARLMYPGRPMTHVLGTLVLGAAGGLAGGIISWCYWSDEADHFQSGNIMLAAIGAVFAIQIWAGVSFVRSLGGRQRAAR